MRDDDAFASLLIYQRLLLIFEQCLQLIVIDGSTHTLLSETILLSFRLSCSSHSPHTNTLLAHHDTAMHLERISLSKKS
jgi:hypothetical protein